MVGLGSISFEHLERICRMPGSELVGVCDLSETLARAVAERVGAGSPFTDFTAMLQTTVPDVVHVLTPPHSHRPLVLQALAAGAHVLVEKPIAVRWEEYVELREAAATSGRILCENHNYRFTDVVLKALDLWGAGRIGEMVAVDVSFGGVMGPTGPYADRDLPHFAHDLPGGALQNFVTHPVSLALAFLGHCSDLAAWQRRIHPKAIGSDELRALLSGERASAVIAVTANANPPTFWLRVQGSEGTLEADIYNRRLELHSVGSAAVELLRQGTGRLTDSARLFGRRLAGRQAPYEGLGTLLERFYAAVRGEGPPPVSVAEMDEVNRVVDRLFVPDRQL